MSVAKICPRARVNVLSLAWTPAPAQQEFLLEHRYRDNIVNEPEPSYGWKTSYWQDNDFLDGETDVSVFRI